MKLKDYARSRHHPKEINKVEAGLEGGVGVVLGVGREEAHKTEEGEHGVEGHRRGVGADVGVVRPVVDIGVEVDTKEVCNRDDDQRLLLKVLCGSSGD